MLKNLLIGFFLCALGGTVFYLWTGYQFLVPEQQIVLSNSASPADSNRLDGAVKAATAAVSDMTDFCKRQPAACEVGGQASTLIAERASEGARKIYKAENEKDSQKQVTEKAEPAKESAQIGNQPNDCAKANLSLGIDSDDCESAKLESLISGLRRGEYIFNKPDRAFVGVPFRIVLILKTVPEDQDASGEYAKTLGELQSVKASYGRSMEATLRGLDLTIDPGGPQRRTATSLNFVEWEWIVTPKESGDKALTIDVNAILYIKDSQLPYQLKTFHTDIDIAVTPFQRIKTVVAQISGTILGASTVFAGFLALFTTLKPVRRRLLRFVRERRRKHARRELRDV